MQENHHSVGLLDLSPCVLSTLLQYLDATSLYNLSRTHPIFEELIETSSKLWRHIDARRAPNGVSKTEYCIQRIHKGTHSILFRADHRTQVIAPEDFYLTVSKFQCLKILALENQTIDKEISIMAFPASLEELSLKKSATTEGVDFFRLSGHHMTKLRVLILDESSWVTTSCFMSISKYPKLEILSVYKCRNVENSIAYLSMSFQNGFQSLKVVDARLSPLGNTLIRSLYKSQSILAVYLQNANVTYKLDYCKRKIAIAKGARTRDYYVEDSEFNCVYDMLKLEQHRAGYVDIAPLDDRGILDYLSTESQPDNHEVLPQSVLYLDPYNKCTCDYESRRGRDPGGGDNGDDDSGKRLPPPPSNKSSDDSSDDDNDDGKPKRKPKKRNDTLLRMEENSRRLSEFIRQNRTSTGFFNSSHHRRHFPSLIVDRHLSAFVNLSGFEENAARKRKQENDVWSKIYKEITNSSSDEDEGKEEEEAGSSASILNGIQQHNEETDQNSPATTNGSSEASGETRKRPLQRSYEHKSKKPKTDDPSSPGNVDDPKPGPSRRLQQPVENNDSSSDESVDLELLPPAVRVLRRSPTPHPDVIPAELVFEDGVEGGQYHYMPVVRVVDINRIAREVKVPLKRLSLRGFRRITNTALTYIRELNLEVLDLTYTSVTYDAIMDYIHYHPNCRVVHEQFCVCPTNLHF